MVQSLDPVFRVDALDRHHGCQDLYFGDASRVAGEQRLDVERLRRDNHEIHPIARYVHARQRLHYLVDLRNNDAPLESSRFDDRGGILCVRTHVKIARAVSAASDGQGNVGSEVDEVAGEKLAVGVDCAELDFSGLQDARYCMALRSREGKVELLGNAFLEQVDML